MNLSGNSEMHAIRETLRKALSIDISHYRNGFIEGCIQRRMRKLGVGTLPEYVNYLRRDHHEPQLFCEALSIYHSQFVRDREKYIALAHEILPDLIKRKRAEAGAAASGRPAHEPRPSLRVWSAGCAGGEEPYSVAILLAELLGDEIDWWDIAIHGVDINEAAIAKAAEGTYAEEELLRKGMPQRFIDGYFTPADGGMMRISEKLRRMLHFQTANLLSMHPLPAIDILFCRNVLIYFNRETICRLLLGFHRVINNGGYLVLGNAEVVEDSLMCHYNKIKCKGEYFYRKITPGSEEHRNALERQAAIRAGLGIQL